MQRSEMPGRNAHPPTNRLGGAVLTVGELRHCGGGGTKRTWFVAAPSTVEVPEGSVAVMGPQQLSKRAVITGLRPGHHLPLGPVEDHRRALGSVAVEHPHSPTGTPMLMRHARASALDRPG
jgi:hypothetical protein